MKFHITYIIQLFLKPIRISWCNFYKLHVLMLTLHTHDIMIFWGMNGKLASGNFFWKWISLVKGENGEIIEMSIRNSWHKIAIKKNWRKKILTKCTHFISRYFLDMMHDRLNCRLCLLLCSLSLTEGCCLINLENYLHFIELLYFLKKMREIDLAVINAYVKAWIKKYVWKSRQMREYWQVCNMFTSNSSNKFNSDFANTFTSASATCSPVPRETCSPVP